MKLTVYGGINEIGGNKVLVEDDGTCVFLDFGMSFSRHQAFFDDYLKPRSVLSDLLRLGLLPPMDGIYREDLIRPAGWRDATAGLLGIEPFWDAPVLSGEEYRARHGKLAVDAVLLSHAHADHVNHIAYLDPRIPVFCSPVTRTLVRAISDVSKGGVENEFSEVTPRAFERSKPESKQATFPGSWAIKKSKPEDVIQRKYDAVPELSTFTVGSLRVTFIPVDHSVPGACAIYLQGKGGKSVLYSGDIRFHGNLTDRQKALRDFAGDRRPDLLLCEGTRINEDSGDTEGGVEEKLTRTIGSSKGLSMVEFGWKDTTRFETLQRVAAATGRTLVVSPKLSYLLAKLRDDFGKPYLGVREYPNVRSYLDRRRSLAYSKSDYSNEKYVAGEAIDWPDTEPKWTPGEREIFLRHYEHGARATEIRAHPDRFILSLTFFEMNDLHDLAPPVGSTFVRAQCEPFNDEMKLDEAKQTRWLSAFGINADTDGALLKAHASGHGSGPDIKAFAKSVNAKRLLPIHTVHPQEFDGLAKDVVSWGPQPGEPLVVEV